MHQAKPPDTPPLAGIRVLEVGHGLASPFCGMQLADLGATVVKLENPRGGDMLRSTGPFVDGESANYLRVNRNKRSIAVDLKSAKGREVCLRLVERADVMLENFRPGTMDDLGLAYPDLADRNPRLIYVGASGWGKDGPYAELAGVDLMAQAMSGLMSVMGEAGGSPVSVGVPICDLVCALYGTIGALAALQARERTGRGQFVDVCLFETGVSLGILGASAHFTDGRVPAPLGSAHHTNAPYQAIRAADKWFTVGAISPRTWTAFCAALELTALEDDPRFELNHLRWEHRAELIELVERVTVQAPAAHWLSRLQEAGVPCAPLQDYGEVARDPHLLARDFFVDLPHTTAGMVRQLGSPLRLSETPVELRWSAPVLGEHSLELLTELGYDDDEAGALVSEGVIGARG